MPDQDQIALEVWGEVALHFDRIESLAAAMSIVIEAEERGEATLKQGMLNDLAHSVGSAVEIARSMFEAHYHPGSV